MLFQKVKELINREVSTETKKRRLLRMACVTWASISLILTIKSVASGTYDPSQLWISAVTFLVIFSIFLVDLKGHHNLARYLITFALCVSIISNSFFIMPGKNVGLFLIILGPFSVFFIDRSWVQHLIFSVAFGAFIILPDFTGIESETHKIFSLKIIFVFLFFLVKDVDSVNKKSEQSLNKQKLKAEKDKELIELQKKKLDELSDFKNRFFINIAHELRTPLTLINGLANQIEKDKKTKLTTGIINQSDKMKQIVDDILDLSKLHTDTLKIVKEKLNINTVLNNVFQSFIYSFNNKELDLNLVQNDDIINVNIDLVYFERALNNILLNALKFTEKGHVTISTIYSNNELILTIEDTGIGIANSELEKVFSEFYQVDNDVNRAGGTGVGLSFAKSIIEQHSGTIEVQSILGTGTSFKIKLPAVISDSSKKVEIKKTSENSSFTIPTNNKNATILVVEDHPEMRTYISSLLTDYNVLEAGNGIEALEVIDKNKIDFVVTDYMMPKMDGYEFIQKLKSKNINVPVIVLTARADKEAKIKTLRLGIDDYLVKPFNPEELLVRIDNSLTNNAERITYLAEQSEGGHEPVIEEVKEDPKDGFIYELSEFIKSNCSSQTFNLEMIREEFALSISSLYRKVKSETGMSPIEFVKEVRLQKGRDLLELDADIPMKSLALQIGINNTTYFKKQYFKRFGKNLNA